MNQDGWRDFESALDSPEDLALAKLAHQDDPAALAELEGLENFRKEIRAQGLKVPVPAAHLEQRLLEMIQGRKKVGQAISWRRILVPVAGVAILAAAIWWIRQDPMNFAITPTEGIFEAPTEAEAESWIEANTDFDVPKLKFPREAVLVTARYGKAGAWACVDFVHHGETYWLYINRSGAQLDQGQVQTFDGLKFYDGQGVGWKSRNLSFYLKGGSHAERWKFATFLAPQTRS